MNEEVTIVINDTQHEGTLVNGFVYLGRRKATYGTAVSNTGKSIKETIWDELDDVMDLMMESGEPDSESFDDGVQYQSIRVGEFSEAWRQYGKWQGTAEAICFVIALFENPEHPDIDSVKGTAVLRWKGRQQERIPEDKTMEDVKDEVVGETSAELSSEAKPANATN